MAIAGSYRNALNQLGAQRFGRQAFLRNLLPASVGLQAEPGRLQAEPGRFQTDPMGNLSPPAPPLFITPQPMAADFTPQIGPAIRAVSAGGPDFDIPEMPHPASAPSPAPGTRRKRATKPRVGTFGEARY